MTHVTTWRGGPASFADSCGSLEQERYGPISQRNRLTVNCGGSGGLGHFSKARAGHSWLAPKSGSETTLHTDVFFLAQSSRDLVCANRAGGDRSWRVHVSQGPRSKTHALHPCLLENSSTVQVEVYGHPPENIAMLTNSQRRVTS